MENYYSLNYKLISLQGLINLFNKREFTLFLLDIKEVCTSLILNNIITMLKNSLLFYLC